MNEKISTDKKNSIGTKFYPVYHAAPPVGWMNDPNGFCFFNGEYHLFYQHHPYSAEWGPMHWGHMTSKNLFEWKHLPIAIAPDRFYDKDGCFSGSAIEKDGQLYLMYTGHVIPNVFRKKIHLQTQCIARSSDGINFEKFSGNPVIGNPGDHRASKYDFRDPKVWEHDGKFYAVVGSKIEEEDIGQILLFESEDLEHWNFKSIAAKATENLGYMWECPNFATIDGKEILILSPQGIEQEGIVYQNVYQSGYMVGNLNYETGIFTHEDFHLLDYGSDFYAPQITQTPDGRTILIGWLDMWYEKMPEQEDGWAGMMTVPRELRLKNGKIFSVPAKELEGLRKEKISYEKLSLTEPTKLEKISGDIGELIVDVNTGKTPAFGIELRVGEKEKTIIEYAGAEKILILNRKRSGKGPGDTREVELNPGENLTLRIYLDKSSVEIFINDGEAVMSSRIYPDESSRDIIFVPWGNSFEINSVTFYSF